MRNHNIMIYLCWCVQFKIMGGQIKYNVLPQSNYWTSCKSFYGREWLNVPTSLNFPLFPHEKCGDGVEPWRLSCRAGTQSKTLHWPTQAGTGWGLLLLLPLNLKEATESTYTHALWAEQLVVLSKWSDRFLVLYVAEGDGGAIMFQT